MTLAKVGLHLFDVVTVTDDRSIPSHLYRVRGIGEVHDAMKDPFIYRQRVTLRPR